MQSIAQGIYAKMKRAGAFTGAPLANCLRASGWAQWGNDLEKRLRDEGLNGQDNTL